MNDRQAYLFDLNGYILIDDVLTAEEILDLNRSIDANLHAVVDDQGDPIQFTRFKGAKKRGYFDSMLTWEDPFCKPFRRLLSHPDIVPFLSQILGAGFRLDHLYGLVMKKGAEGLPLHGGGAVDDATAYYRYFGGRIRCGLTVVSWALTDCELGDGGFVCVPGSHKANFPIPLQIRSARSSDTVVQPIAVKAGSVLIFTESLTHGSFPWVADRERRALFYKYCPGGIAYDNGYLPPGVASVIEEFSPEERSVLRPPYSPTHPYLGESPEVR